MDEIQAGQAIVDAGQEAPEQIEAQEKPATPPPAAKPSLAETIRQAREAREAAARREQESNSYKERAERAEAEIEKLRKSADPRKDVLAWARAQNLSKEEQAEMGQVLLYDIVPDKAPANFRVKLLESRYEREKVERERAEQEAKERARVEGEQRLLNDYQSGVQQAARSFAEGSHPESEAWFGSDRDAWARSLLATAQNMSQSAAKSGQQVDISPANVARVLEADIAARMEARDKARASKAQKQAEGAKASGAEQSTGNPTSTKGLSTGGPRGPALTEKERIERAIAAAFPTGR